MSKQVVERQYDPYTGKWKDIYGPSPSSGGKAPIQPKAEENKKQATKQPDKPVSPNQKNDHRGSGEDNKNTAEEKIRYIEYDLEGTAEIRPIVDLRSKFFLDMQGLGSNFSGKYWISTVVHTINRGGYSMSVDLLRSNFGWKADPIGKKEAPVKATKSEPKKIEPKKEEPKARYYVVKKGDTLWAIAKRFYGNGNQYMRIANANPSIKNPNLIYPNQKLLIP